MLYPSYLNLYNSGKLRELVSEFYDFYSNCSLCPRNCGVNRNKETGICKSSNKIKIASFHQHFGEENPLVGKNGSGTIFLSNCNMYCIYCQNSDISFNGEGDIVEDEDLAKIMIKLQNSGCHNINFVSPTHYLPNIINGVLLAIEKGLNIPLVYNTGGYDNLEIIKKLDGIIDLYLPDCKYMENKNGELYSSGIKNYVPVIKEVLKEMHRQVGVLQTNEYGVAQKGLMIRHLVLPDNIAGTKEFLEFIATEIGVDTYINIMDQYHPSYNAYSFPELSRRITSTEYSNAIKIAADLGFSNLD